MDVTKIIKATAVRGRTSTAASVIKEDHGLYLLIGGIDLPEVYEVDFSNEEHAGTSVTMVGNADGVLIPTQFIKSGKDVFAFYYHVGDDFGRTLYTIRIPNKLRPDRTDEAPTPEEQSVIDQAISALNTAVAKTAQDVIDAGASATAAAQSATNAAASATASATSAGQAAASATSAGQSAVSAAGSATSAGQSATSASASAASAETSADRAEQAANTAGWVDFYVDEDGYLHYVKAESTGLDFYVDAEGYLHVVMED